MDKKGLAFNIIDFIAGVLIIAGGIILIGGKVNGGSLLTSIGLLIELIKLVIKQGW